MQKVPKNWLLAALGLIVLILVVILALTHSNNTKPAITATVPSASSATKNNVYQQQASPSVGKYLADPKGNTLYTYDKDKPGTSNCDATCIKTWPPYGPKASEPIPSNLTVIKRPDGSSQFAYKGQPLYYFVTDNAPGAILGNGLHGFHVAVL